MSSQSTATPSAVSLLGVGSAARVFALTLATLTTGLISGFFYAYDCSVTLGLALLPDEQYVEAMQGINARVRNGVFAFGFFGAVLSLLLALAAHARGYGRAASRWWRWPAYSTSGAASW